MEIAAIETIRTRGHANLLWVRVEGGDGRAGTGETFFAPASVEAYIHEVAAPLVLGRDTEEFAAINRDLVRQPVGYASSGVEMRAASAIDMAIWDLRGLEAGLPAHALLGGAARDSIAVYNTCAGPRYVTDARSPDIDRWFGTRGPRHPLDDLLAFETDAGALARELVAEGILGMKMWPFDRAAFANKGRDITQAQIDEGLEPFKRARDAVGERIDLMVELHALWDRASAERIVAAVAPLAPAWIEDPIRMDDTQGVAALARGTDVPILGCETLAPSASFDAPIGAGAFGVVCCDPGWCGGITQAREIVAKAARAELPFAVHDCTGPIGFAAGAHLSIHAPTSEVQETVRAYLRGWYAEIADGLPQVERGVMRAPQAPGIGAELKPAFLEAPDTMRRRSERRP